MTLMSRAVSANRQTVFAAMALLVIAMSAEGFPIYFISREHYVYYWDYSGYWLMYSDLASSFLAAPMATARRAFDCIRDCDYGPLPVLPLVPIEWLFGSGRLTYILAIVNLYLLPCALLMGLLIERIERDPLGSDNASAPPPQLRPSPPLVALATASFLALSSLWAPLLRGMPDILGILAIGAVLLLHLPTPLHRQSAARLVATGCLLCFLVLVRRWYIFWVVAFFPATLFAHALDIFEREGLASRRHLVTIRNLIVIGLVFSILLCVIATPFVSRALNTDYSDIYSAYRVFDSFIGAVADLPSYFGSGVLICSFAGLGWLAARSDTRPVGCFLVVQSALAFWLFLRIQDFEFHHYYLLTPAVGLGIAALSVRLWTTVENRFWRAAAVGLVATVVLASSASVFFPAAADVSDRFASLALLPRTKIHPLIRNDLNSLDKMSDRLDEMQREQPGDVYVLASSYILNSSIVQNSCKYGPRPRAYCDRILTTNDVDRRDGFPYQFLKARYLVVASPIQYHMHAEDQRVVGVLAREVAEGLGIGASYRQISGEYALDGGVSASIFMKTRSFEQQSLSLLSEQFSQFYPDKGAFFRVDAAE